MRSTRSHAVSSMSIREHSLAKRSFMHAEESLKIDNRFEVRTSQNCSRIAGTACKSCPQLVLVKSVVSVYEISEQKNI